MFQLRHHSISRKLTLMNMAVSGSALLLACASFLVYDAVTLWQNLARYAASQADVIATNTASALVFDDPETAEKTLAALSSSPNVVSAVVYQRDGTPFAHYAIEPSFSPPPMDRDVSLGAQYRWLEDGLQIVFLRPIVSEGATVGFVSTGVLPVTLYERITRYLGIAGIVLAISLLAALLVSSVFQRAVAKPIRHLAEVAESVSREKQYSIRAAAAEESSDEIGVLIRAFNDMLAQIQERDSALQQAHDGLEARVQERTAELQRAEETLRNLSGRLLTLQDEERRSIARELHDSTGQVLAALSLNLTIVQMEGDNLSPSAAKVVDDCINMVTEMSRELRTLSHLLHPPLLDEAGLESALRWYVQGFSERSGIQAELELSDFGRQTEEIETAVFRIVQESLTNVHRHSGSPTARVRVTRGEDSVRVEVSDRGKGMTAESQSKRAELGIGIQGMRERVSQLGGHFEIRSDATGTTVIANFPCRPVRESDPWSPTESSESSAHGAEASLPKNPR